MAKKNGENSLCLIGLTGKINQLYLKYRSLIIDSYQPLIPLPMLNYITLIFAFLAVYLIALLVLQKRLGKNHRIVINGYVGLLLLAALFSLLLMGHIVMDIRNSFTLPQFPCRPYCL